MTFQMATDGRTVTHISKRKTPVYGRDRKGVQAYDLLFQMTDPMQKEMTSPRVEKPRVLIETFRIVGEDLMTAQDNALYEFLLANARERGIEKDTHVVSVETMRKYLGIDHNGRVAESLERITRTVVRYDFRDEETRTYGAMPMILAEITEDLRSGGSTLTYAIPSPIRHVVLAAKQYAMLEINVFPKFNSRYSSRLYQRLALRAGMDEELRKPWEISPLKLAIELGFPLDKDGTVHMTSLMRRCVEPAVSEIQQHVRRFKVSMKTVAQKKKGRGRPKIESIVFKVTTAEKIPEEHQAARLTPSGLRLARMHDDVHEHDELPGTLAIGKAITMTGLDEFTLINGWKAMLDRAKANPNAEAVEGVQGGFFLYVLNREGVAPAFYLWAEAAKKAGTIDIMRQLPAVAKTPQIADSAPKAPITAPAAQIEKGLLEGVKEIVVPIDEIADREKVAAKIRSTIQLGDDPVTVSIRYYEGEGFHTEKVAELWLEEEGFQMLKERTERDLMSDLEMVR